MHITWDYAIWLENELIVLQPRRVCAPITACTTKLFLLLPRQSSSPPSSFPLHYLSAHADLLGAHCQLLSACVALHTIPPPVMAIGNPVEQKVRH